MLRFFLCHCNQHDVFNSLDDPPALRSLFFCFLRVCFLRVLNTTIRPFAAAAAAAAAAAEFCSSGFVGFLGASLRMLSCSSFQFD